VLHPEDRRLAHRRVQVRLPLGLDAEQLGDKRAQRARCLDEQLRLLGRRQRLAVAVRRQPRRQRGLVFGQLGTEACIQRREPLGLVEVAVSEAFDAEREVSRLVARRAPGAVRESKCGRLQSWLLIWEPSEGSQALPRRGLSSGARHSPRASS